MMDNECEYCDGRGRVFNPSMICLQIRHEVNKQAKQTEAAAIRVEAAPVVIDYIHHNKLDVNGKMKPEKPWCSEKLRSAAMTWWFVRVFLKLRIQSEFCHEFAFCKSFMMVHIIRESPKE